MDEFLKTVASISYIGDRRFLFGAENKNKIKNLVEGNRNNFYTLYKNAIINSKDMNSMIDINEENVIIK